MDSSQPIGVFTVRRRVPLAAVLFLSIFSSAQNPVERMLPVPVAKIQVALKALPGGTSGPLPVLDGFVISGARDFEEYQRPFYQCTVHVSPATSGGSLVRVTAKITAWNSSPPHSGYEVLPSNGRIESDLLDRLEQSLGLAGDQKPPASANTRPVAGPATPNHRLENAPELAAPMPQFPSLSSVAKPTTNSAPQNSVLDHEAKALEELIRNQAHPTNLIAVRSDQTPVLQNPSSDAKVLFLASAEDEFEILDQNPEWIHVRISGLSRGWLRRSSVEILDGSDVAAESATPSVPQGSSPASVETANKLFSVTGEEEGSFPGDWEPLKGKTVQIISIQQAPGTGVITSPQDKMHFAENLFKTRLTEKSLAGLVLIFDAEDGGVVAAPRVPLDLWKTGALSEQAFWKQCYLDPPEILGNSN
jgi:hypothetical protein